MYWILGQGRAPPVLGSWTLGVFVTWSLFGGPWLLGISVFVGQLVLDYLCLEAPFT